VIEDLTQKENEIIKLVAQGLSNKEIAKSLFVEESTVKIHLNHVFSKLGLKSRAQLIAHYYTNMMK
jgi:DNA-binding NarL/FixJ family response regulator